MQYKKISLDEIEVNKANDRHGEMLSEDAAIEWLLTHRAAHMRNLAKDIVTAGQIYEPPLVRKEGDKYVVYDGNRRTTNLKLLQHPQKAPSSDWSKFFSTLRQQWNGEFPESIDCQVEQDPDRLDEILFRRHTGQQSGVGQSQWDQSAKTNFERRTGKNTKIDLAEEIELLLLKHGRLQSNQRIPRSNMKRLLSAEQFRNRAGISIEENKLVLTHQQDKVLDALTRIATDLIDKEVTLDDLWDNVSKRAYLDRLDRGGHLPTVTDLLIEKAPPETDRKPRPNSKEPQQKKSTPTEKRRTLIRDIDHGLFPTQANRRALDIFDELQHRLKFEQHDNAIAVLFRVLLEISIDLYIKQQAVPAVHPNDKLANKFSKALDHMVAEGRLDKKQRDALRRFENSEVLISTSTMHSYVHSTDFFPSDHHLKTMWDNLEHFVILAINAKP